MKKSLIALCMLAVLSVSTALAQDNNQVSESKQGPEFSLGFVGCKSFTPDLPGDFGFEFGVEVNKWNFQLDALYNTRLGAEIVFDVGYAVLTYKNFSLIPEAILGAGVRFFNISTKVSGGTSCSTSFNQMFFGGVEVCWKFFDHLKLNLDLGLGGGINLKNDELYSQFGGIVKGGVHYIF